MNKGNSGWRLAGIIDAHKEKLELVTQWEAQRVWKIYPRHIIECMGNNLAQEWYLDQTLMAGVISRKISITKTSMSWLNIKKSQGWLEEQDRMSFGWFVWTTTLVKTSQRMYPKVSEPLTTMPTVVDSLWFRMKYLNNSWIDCHETLCDPHRKNPKKKTILLLWLFLQHYQQVKVLTPFVKYLNICQMYWHSGNPLISLLFFFSSMKVDSCGCV